MATVSFRQLRSHKLTAKRWSLRSLVVILSAALSGCMLFSNVPPVASIQASTTSGTVPLYVELDGGASYDPDGAVVHYQWAFGDGTSANQIRSEHAFSIPGGYTITLTVRDNNGATASAQVAVRVNAPNRPPVAVAQVSPDPATVGEPVTFDASGSTDVEDKIIAYSWEFGDGTSAATPSTTYTYVEPGTYTVALLVIDAAGAGCRTTHVLEVQLGDLAPQPVISSSSDSVQVGEAVRFDGGDSFDRDGVILNYSWDFGDGAASTGSSTAHAYASSGIYRVRLTVTDDIGLRESVELRIRVGDSGSSSDTEDSETVSRLLRSSFARRT